MGSYPEHDKLQAIQAESQAIGAFLDWCNEVKGINLMSYRYDPATERGYYALAGMRVLLEQYFGIDPVVLEREKREMLDQQRRLNDDAFTGLKGNHPMADGK